MKYKSERPIEIVHVNFCSSEKLLFSLNKTVDFYLVLSIVGLQPTKTRAELLLDSLTVSNNNSSRNCPNSDCICTCSAMHYWAAPRSQ